MKPILAAAIAFALFMPTTAWSGPSPERVETATRITEGVPPVPATLSEQLQRYQNTRKASLLGWSADGKAILIGTRFGSTAQVHRVRMPGGAREQLTFYDEPINEAVAHPRQNGFVFGKDVGGSEFWQLYAFDDATRTISLLTDGKSRNSDATFSADGGLLAYSSTVRNGKDTDIWLRDMRSGQTRALVTLGGKGSWRALNFSADAKQLLVADERSVNETIPAVVDVASGTLTPLFATGKVPVAYGDLSFSADGKQVYYTADAGSEFLELRRLDLDSRRSTSLTAQTPWDVEEFQLSHDGKLLAYVTNEDGISKVHVLDLASGSKRELPTLPTGVIEALHFSPDDQRLAFTLSPATSPSDVYSIELAAATLTRWTESEIGGLDSATFRAPELIHFPTFDKIKGSPRQIPAFYYKPAGDGPFPSVILVHGGPESQSRPLFNPDIQFLATQLGIAVIVPNVRGSTGYGKSYVMLDNGFRREDSVRDIGALLDWIRSNKQLDAGRVGIIGGSYGGYMVLAALTHYSDRLSAGVEIVGISNFNTFLANTESYRRDLRRAEYGDERDPKMQAFLEQISPLTNAAKIKRPLFVAQGANDPRVPASEAEQIVGKVRGNGGTVWYLLQKDEGHGFQKKANRDFYNASAVQFWQQYLLGESKP